MELRERSAGEFFVQRDVLDELDLDKLGRKKTHSTKPSVAERVKDYLRCSGPRLKQMVLGCVPVLSWLPHYSIRENGVGDLIAGVSVGIMHLPQGMAYALLASLPPVFGLYTSFYPVLVYFFFGTSRHISVGTFAVISIMIGSVTEKLAPDSDFPSLNGTNVNGTAGLDIGARDAQRVQVAVALTVLTGLFQILLGLVRFGFVVTYLSEPLIRGYTTGAACHVTISQVKYLFGIKPQRFSGPLSQVYTLWEIFKLLGGTKVPELVVSLVSLAVLIVVKELNAYYSKKLPLPIPIELIVIIGATIISYFADLPANYDIDAVGAIPSGLVAPRVPDVSWFSEMIGDAFAVAIVAYAISISLGKTFALKHGYKVDSNQELVALGLSNTIGGFFQCYCVTSSLSRSLIQESTGGKTQMAGVVSSIIVLVTVLKIGALFEDLPKAVLATIVFVNLKGMFRQFLDVPALWKSNRVDLLVWIVTFLATLLLNLDLGLALAIAFSILTVIFKTQLPHYSILGQVPGTELYLDTDTYEEAKPIPGITVFRSSTTVYYTNAEMYLETLQEKSGIDIGKLLEQKKKHAAKLRRQQAKEKKGKEEAKEQGDGKDELNEDKLSSKASWNQRTRVNDMKEEKSQMSDVDLTETPANGHVNLAFHHDGNVSESDSHGGGGGGGGDGERDGAVRHSVILDLSTTSFVDTVTVKTLKNIFRDFGEIDVDIYLAACQACVVEQLERASFFSESVPKSRLFASIHDAVLHVVRSRRGRSLTDDVTAHHHRDAGDDAGGKCVVDISCMTKL